MALWEQIELARASSEGKTFAPIRLRNIKDKLTGELERFVSRRLNSCISPVSFIKLVRTNWNDGRSGPIKAIVRQVII